MILYWLVSRNSSHDPVFDLYYKRTNNEYCYCLNRNQLGQYWQCVVKDRDTFCPSHCDSCTICKEMSDGCEEVVEPLNAIRKTSVLFISSFLSLISARKS